MVYIICFLFSITGEEDLRYLINLRTLMVDNNQIQTISKETFKYNLHLTYISFGNNKLTMLEPGLLNPLKYLEEADFYQNQIKSIPNLMVSVNARLHTVDLSHNRLMELPEHAFANMKNYGSVDINLSHNKLTTLKSSSFQNSKDLYPALFSNQLHCDCSFLANFKQIISNNNAMVEEALCSTPPPFKGLDVESIIPQAIGCSLCNNNDNMTLTNQVSCKNEGKCVIPNPLVARFKCECQPGYEGELCENLNIDILKKTCENNKCSQHEKCVPLSATEYNCTCITNSNDYNDHLGNNIINENGKCSPSAGVTGSASSGRISSVVWIIIVAAIVVVVVGIFVAVYVVISRKKQRTLLIDDVDDDNL